MTVHKRIYAEYAPAHDYALTLQRDHAVSICIVSRDGVHTLTWCEFKNRRDER